MARVFSEETLKALYDAKYPDGTAKDYYALINQSKSAGFTNGYGRCK